METLPLPLVLLVQLLRTDHVALNPQGSELALQPKAKPARFIDRMDLASLCLTLAAQCRNASFR